MKIKLSNLAMLIVAVTAVFYIFIVMPMMKQHHLSPEDLSEMSEILEKLEFEHSVIHDLIADLEKETSGAVQGILKKRAHEMKDRINPKFRDVSPFFKRLCVESH